MNETLNVDLQLFKYLLIRCTRIYVKCKFLVYLKKNLILKHMHDLYNMNKY